MTRLPGIESARPSKYWTLGDGRLGVLFEEVRSKDRTRIPRLFQVYRGRQCVLQVASIQEKAGAVPELLVRDLIAPSSWGKSDRWSEGAEFERKALEIAQDKIKGATPVPLAASEVPARTLPPPLAWVGLLLMVLVPMAVGVVLLNSMSGWVEKDPVRNWLGMLAGFPLILGGFVLSILLRVRMGPAFSNLFLIAGGAAGIGLTVVITGSQDAGQAAMVLGMVMLPVLAGLVLAYLAFQGQGVFYGMWVLLLGIAGPLTVSSLDEGWVPWAAVGGSLGLILAAWPSYHRWTLSLPPEFPPLPRKGRTAAAGTP